jgi:hypothetical protein
MKRALLVAALALLGCATEHVQGPPPKGSLHDTQTIRNTGPTDATRIWIVQTGLDGNQRIVLCDMAFMGGAADPRRLCIAWPP